MPYIILFLFLLALLIPSATLLYWMRKKQNSSQQASKKIKRYFRRILAILLYFVLIAALFCLGINAYVKHSVSDDFLTAKEAADLSEVDCILILGCSVRKDGTPSDMLKDRLIKGIELYHKGAAPKLLMSGDHGQEDYNEVGVMKDFAISMAVPSSDIFMDHAGFSTYESIYRAKEIFGADNIIIVSQRYHLYRALYIADAMGIEAYGVASDERAYAGQMLRNVREILARVKDFTTSLFQPAPAYPGDTIPISGNGDNTNDKEWIKKLDHAEAT